MAEPQDSYDQLDKTLRDYDHGFAWAPDVQQAILYAVENGNDLNTVASLANDHPPPGGGVWVSPVYGPAKFPPRTDQPVDGPGGDDQLVVFDSAGNLI